MGFETPEDILKEYENGLQGAVCNAVDMAKLMEELPRPLFGSIGNELYGTGKGVLALPYKAIQYFFPNFGADETETTWIQNFPNPPGHVIVSERGEYVDQLCKKYIENN